MSDIKPGYVYTKAGDRFERHPTYVVAVRPVTQGHWLVYHATLGPMTAHPEQLAPADDGPYADLIEAFRKRFQNDRSA